MLTIPRGVVDVHVTALGVDVTGANVSVFTAAGAYVGRSALTDSGGFAEFTLPAEDYKFRVDGSGGQHWSGVVTVSEDGSSHVEVEIGE